MSQKFQEFRNKVEGGIGLKIRFLCTDNGGEHTSNEFSTYLKRAGIRRHLICLYTLQQNGVAERKNRHLVEIERSMMHVRNVPSEFWAECLKTASHITNRLPQAKLGFISPISKAMEGQANGKSL